MSIDPTSDDIHSERRLGLFERHPKLSILLIAAIFYVILFGMCAVVAAIIFMGRWG